MTDIPMQTYQEEQEIEPLEPESATSAVIGEVYEDGVTLIFDGNTEPTNKRYKVNTSIVFEKDQRVKLFKDSNTYLVEYPFGAPKLAESSVKLAEKALVADDAMKLAGKTEGQLQVSKAASADFADQCNYAASLKYGNYVFQLRISDRYIQIREIEYYGTGWRNLLSLY